MPHTGQRYHPASGPGWSHLWSVGATPFGPLSSLAALSQPLAAAPLRNLALMELERNLGRLARVLTASGDSPDERQPTVLLHRCHP